MSVVAGGCAKTPSAPKIPLPSKTPGRYVENLKGRDYILRVPKAYDATKRLPLVVVLHGWTSTGASAEAYTHFGDKADQEGFFMVAPNGTGQPQGWNAGFLDLTGGPHPDDVGYIASLLDQVEREVGVDPDRIYVVGHSNGAMLAHLLAARLGNRIAAIGAVAGTIGLPQANGLKTIPAPTAPVSVMLIHGTADKMVAYDRSSGSFLQGVSAPDSARWWARHDVCIPTPLRTSENSGRILIDSYRGGHGGTEVTLVTIVNGGHDWPGRSSGIDVTDRIWRFFAAHPKRG